MKILLFLICLLLTASGNIANAQAGKQSVLEFDKLYIDCENAWVVMGKDNEGRYGYGFVYIDEQGGLTLHNGGTFRINDKGQYTDVVKDTISMKARLEPINKKVALIPKPGLTALGLPVIPAWLPPYLTDTGTVSSLVRHGFIYNAWNRPQAALGFLERAYKTAPHYKGLAMELAFSYNALQQYGKALSTLKDAPEAKTTPCYYYKEFNFAQVKTGGMEAAENTYNNEAAKLCTDNAMKAEMAYNIAYEYYAVKNNSKCKLWLAEARKWAEPGSRLLNAVNAIEADINK